MWLLNPANPPCKPTRAGLRKNGTGTGDVSSVAYHWSIDVELNDDEFQLYPEAAGYHVLFRRLVHQLPQVSAEEVDFELDHRGIALWESPPTGEETGIKWRLAYNYDWTGFGGLASDPPVAFEVKAWTLWYGAEYWRSPSPDDLNIAFPLYSGDEFSGATNLFQGLRPNTLRQHAVGNNVIPGVVLFPDFPAELTLSPWWP